MCDGLSFIDIEVLLRQILTHLLMPNKALYRFNQPVKKLCWDYSERGNVSEPANLDWPLFRTPHFLSSPIEHIATDFSRAFFQSVSVLFSDFEPNPVCQK